MSETQAAGDDDRGRAGRGSRSQRRRNPWASARPAKAATVGEACAAGNGGRGQSPLNLRKQKRGKGEGDGWGRGVVHWEVGGMAVAAVK